MESGESLKSGRTAGSKIGEAFTLLAELFLKRRQVVKFLRFCRERTMPKAGAVDIREFQALIELARDASDHDGPIVEIGTLFGFSTQALVSGKTHGKKLYTVDRFTWNPIGIPGWRHEELTRKNLYYFIQNCNVELCVCDKSDFYDKNRSIIPSLVFIDAGHGYKDVREDISWGLRQEAKIISGHDYSESHPGVVRAVQEFFGDNIELHGSVWVARNKC